MGEAQALYNEEQDFFEKLQVGKDFAGLVKALGPERAVGEIFNILEDAKDAAVTGGIVGRLKGATFDTAASVLVNVVGQAHLEGKLKDLDRKLLENPDEVIDLVEDASIVEFFADVLTGIGRKLGKSVLKEGIDIGRERTDG